MKFYSFFLLLAFSLIANCQPKAPILQIETGVHTSKGYGVSTDREGKYLLTASIDKTARFWDAHTGNLLKTFRIPIGGIYEGTLYACALSPDGKIAAIAGSTGFEWDNSFCIYIINTQTGSFINRIRNLKEVIYELEFSPDGNWLAAGFGQGVGISVFDTKGWGETKLKGVYKKDIKSIAFKKNGGMAVASEGGNIKLYNNRFELIKERTIATGKDLTLTAMALNPAGDFMAISYQNEKPVEILNADDLTTLYKPNIADKGYGAFFTLGFSADGSKLYGGGAILEANGITHYLLCWENAGKGDSHDLPLTKNPPADIQPLPDGSMAMISFDPPEMVVFNSSDKAIWYLPAEKIDFLQDDKSHFRINSSGTSVGFASLADKAYSFDITQRKLQQEQSLFPAPVDANAGTVVKNWNGKWNPSINGRPVAKFDGKIYQQCLATDISSDGSFVALAESWNVIMLDKNATLIWEAPMECHAYALNISGNDKVVTAAMSDGTIRWLSMADGKTLLTFYLHADKKRWVMFTPSGYYDASPGAEDLLGWHINNGPDEAPSFFPVSRFKEKFYRPDIVDAIFETYNEDAAVALANSQSKKQVVTAESDIRQKLPPTIIISSPASGSNISSNTVSINYDIKSPDGAPVKNLRVLIDGRPVAMERGVKLTATADKKITVTVPSQDCTVTLLAENDNGTSPETNLYLKWVTPAAATEEFIAKPKLYVLAIGISDYNNPDFKLGLAAKDAGDFADAIAKQKGTLFNDVIIKKLTDKEATKEAMLDGLEWIQKQTGQKDVAMIFYAGHGINDQNNVFYMLPVAADMDRIRSTCLNFEELKQTVSSIAGKVVVFIDACHSGNVMGAGRRSVTDVNAMVNELSSTENGAITFTSSTGKEFSLEDPTWGNGAFTKALLEGLNGGAAFGGKNKITVKSLDAFISERVKELTGGKQHPTSVTPPNVPDFPIAVKQ